MVEIDWKNIFTEQECKVVSDYCQKNKKEIQEGFKKYDEFILSQQEEFNSPRQFRRETVRRIIRAISEKHNN